MDVVPFLCRIGYGGRFHRLLHLSVAGLYEIGERMLTVLMLLFKYVNMIFIIMKKSKISGLGQDIRMERQLEAIMRFSAAYFANTNIFGLGCKENSRMQWHAF